MYGGNGRDQLFDDQGPAMIFAGNGKDSVFLNGLSQATIDGGTGKDGVFVTLVSDPLGIETQTADVESTGKDSGTIDISTYDDGILTSQTQNTFVNAENIYVNGVLVG
jgi:hypothetical protein